MHAQTILLACGLLAASGLLSIVPALTRPDIFFAVTVQHEFRRTAEARRILRKYLVIVWTFAFAAIALELGAGMSLGAMLLLAGGFLWSLVSAHESALTYAAVPGSVVEVDLAAPRERLPGGPVVAILPVLSLVALGVWASLALDRLPRRFPAHWGIRGADRWVATTSASILGYIAVNACVCLLLIGIAWGVLNRSRRISLTGSGAAAERRFRRRAMQLLIVSEYLLAVPAWFALFQPAAAAINVWGLVVTAVIVVFAVALARSGQGGSRGVGAAGAAPVGDRTPDSCWKWGLIYVNSADPSILIEKRFGIGYTLNFGNRWTWVALAVFLVPVVAASVLLH